MLDDCCIILKINRQVNLWANTSIMSCVRRRMFAFNNIDSADSLFAKGQLFV